MQHWSEPRQPTRRCVRRLAARIGGLAYYRFDPRQRSVIFIHAVEVDHGLASHLVGPDPLVGDQLISLGLSEFAIAATILELDEPAPLVVINVKHGSCMSSMISATIGSSPAERDGHFHGATLVSTRAHQGAAFMVTDEVSADLFRRHLRVAQLPGMR